MPTTEANDDCCPTLILAHRDPRYAAAAIDALRPRWDVRLAHSSAEVRCLARELGAAVVVLGAGALDETGGLTCAKLSRELPGLRIILVAAAPTPELRRFAAFAGAARVVNEGDGPRALLHAVEGKALTAAG
ncbi:MAG TPA: hypothetical protein VJ739_15305 [Gemmataceae bacterium]|nr:hypothetical protein [Gemmataceae bacterium]